MSIYRSDIQVSATIYVRARNYAEAATKIAEARMSMLEVEDTGLSEIAISGVQFDDDRLPDISLSPAMTVYDPVGEIEKVEG